MAYKVTYMIRKAIYDWVYWNSPSFVNVPLELDLSPDNGVGGCCAVGSLQGFFEDYDYNRHPADHHYVTVEAIKQGCKGLVEDGCSLAYATINTKQTLTEAALLECGFVCQTDGWAYRNPKHSSYETGVKVFIKPLYKVLKRARKEE